MSIFGKIIGIAALFAAGKTFLDQDYQQIRKVLWKNLQYFKPFIVQVIETYQFNTFGINNISTNYQKQYIDEQIETLKQAINKINMEELAKSMVSSMKEKK